MGLFSPQISTKALVPLCRQLATSYSAGIPIIRTLELVRSNIQDKRIGEVLDDMGDRIRNGATLADAARKQAPYLPPLFVELLATGEIGGKLDATLLDLANYYEDRLAMRRMIIGKAAYPILQLLFAWFCGTFALGISRHLSFTTKSFSFDKYLHSYARFQMSAMILFAVAFFVCVGLARAGIFQWIWGWVATYIWPLAPITLRFAQARFFRCLSLLIASGVPITHAIERAASVTANPYVAQDFLQVLPRVKRGDTLVEAFSSCRFLSRVGREMLSVGEESGQLEQTLYKVSQYQMDEATHAVNVGTRVGEVVVGLAVAAIIGYVVISFYSNYYGALSKIR